MSTGDGAAPPKYRRDIDGLRAIAVGAVVVHHVFPTISPGGFIGVDVFFVLSGFLITGILLSAFEKDAFTYRDFYTRRIMRIFPTLILVLSAALVAGWWLTYPEDYAQLGKHTLGGSTFVSNFLFWSESGYFDQAADAKPLLHLWSLAIEEQFYIFWPIVLAITHRRGLPFLAVAGTIAAASLALNLALTPFDATHAFYSPLPRAWELMVGGLLAWIGLYRPTWLARGADLRSAVGFAALGAGLWLLDPARAFPGAWALLPVLGTALIVSAGGDAWLNRTLLANRPAVWLGLISYPLYLWHWPVLYFAGDLLPNHTSRLGRLTVIVVSVALAGITYRGLENQVRHRRAPAAVLGTAAALALCGVLGGIVYGAGGFPQRVPASYRALMAEHGGIIDPDETCMRNGDADFPASCTTDPRRPLVMLWGDSHANALRPGLDAVAAERGLGVVQVTGSSCAPVLHAATRGNAACEAINDLALTTAQRLQPDWILLHATWAGDGYDLRGLEATIAEIRRATAAQIVVIGPVPQWRGSLSKSIYLCLDSEPDPAAIAPYSRCGSNPGIAPFEPAFQERMDKAGVTYVSALGPLCTDQGCLRYTPAPDPGLTSFDAAHLSPSGARFLMRRVADAVGWPRR